MNGLKLADAAIAIGTKPILTALSFSLLEGECVGILGPNGSGKSTLLKAMAGILPHRGSIHLDEIPLQTWKRKQISQRIAYLPQGGEVHWPLTVRTLVSLGRLPFAHRYTTNTRADGQAIDQAMQDCEVGHLQERAVTSLSGGERARVLLARALAGGANIILADEPFAQLDPHHQIHAMELLRSKANSGALVVVVLHDLAIAARHCTRTILLADGRIAADATPSAALTAENLRHVFGVDAFIGDHQGAPVILPLQRRVTRLGV